MEKLTQSFYERPAADVAKDLIGRSLIYQGKNERQKAILTEIAAYEGEEKTTSAGVLFAPGTISLSTKFNQVLIDIATGKAGKPSCVTLRRALFDLENKVEEASGPGILSRKLGINKNNKDLMYGTTAYGNTLWIEGEPAELSKIRVLKGNSRNCKGIYRVKF